MQRKRSGQLTRREFLGLPPTPLRVLEDARRVALDEGLRYVYLMNVPGHEGNNTFCEGCGKPVVERVGFKVLADHLSAGRCPSCGISIPGHWA